MIVGDINTSTVIYGIYLFICLFLFLFFVLVTCKIIGCNKHFAQDFMENLVSTFQINRIDSNYLFLILT